MRTYDADFRLEAVKLAGEIGTTKAAKELNMPSGTLDTWVHKAKNGLLKGAGSSPKTALTLAEENKRLMQENRELRRTNEILSKAAAFFAQSQKK
jgi:transposase